MNPSCSHHHLRFEDGTLYIVCIDCGQPWIGLEKKDGAVDRPLQFITAPYGDDTRHGRFVFPKTK